MALKALVCGSNGDPSVACYWDEDYVVHYLDVPVTAIASSAKNITKVGSDIYICGTYTEAGSLVTACVWTNGVRADLPGFRANATGLFVHEGVVYVAGRYYTGVFHQACYWVDGVKVDLSPSEYSFAYDIWTDGTDIIIGGDTNAIGACVWTNGVISYLPFAGEYGWVYSMSVYDGVVYCSGYDYDGSVDVPCYWVDDVEHLLDATGGVVVQKIFVDASGIHMVGADDYDAASTACSWLGEVRTDLEMGSWTYTYGMAIAAVGGTVYCVGNGSGATQAALLWTDPDTMVELSTDNGGPVAIYMWDEPAAAGGSWFGR